MPLIKDAKFVDDQWRYLADDEPIPADAPVILTLSRWKSENAHLLSRNAPIGIKLESEEDSREIAGDVHRFQVIALDFPHFKNGRAYSHAYLLRHRYGYKGELRATGDVLRDQLLFMARCGFDAFEVSDRIKLSDFHSAMSEISVFFQPSADLREPVFSRRHRLRDHGKAKLVMA